MDLISSVSPISPSNEFDTAHLVLVAVYLGTNCLLGEQLVLP